MCARCLVTEDLTIYVHLISLYIDCLSTSSQTPKWSRIFLEYVAGKCLPPSLTNAKCHAV